MICIHTTSKRISAVSCMTHIPECLVDGLEGGLLVVVEVLAVAVQHHGTRRLSRLTHAAVHAEVGTVVPLARVHVQHLCATALYDSKCNTRTGHVLDISQQHVTTTSGCTANSFWDGQILWMHVHKTDAMATCRLQQ